MERVIQRVEMAEDDYPCDITLNGETAFGIIWEDGRSIYLFDNSTPEDMTKM